MNRVLANHSEQLLSIGQVTALTGVGKSTLRHWEREFHDILDSVRTEGNQRRFTPDAVKKIEKIKEMVEDHGLTLRGVRVKLTKLEEEHRTKSESSDETTSGEIPNESLRRLAELMTEHIVKRLFHER